MYSRSLHRFAVLTAVATLGLVGVGGLVTSHGAGMAVPDWPNTYGYNMFFFPISQWVGGIFYEHTHRLAASAVGLLTVVLALWLYGRSARPLMRWRAACCCSVLGPGWRRRDAGLMAWSLGADRPGVVWRELGLAALRAEPEMAAPAAGSRPSWPWSCKGCSAGCAWCSTRTPSASSTPRWRNCSSC